MKSTSETIPQSGAPHGSIRMHLLCALVPPLVIVGAYLLTGEGGAGGNETSQSASREMHARSVQSSDMPEPKSPEYFEKRFSDPDFAAEVRALSSTDVHALAAFLQDYLERDREAALAWAEELCESLVAEGEQGRALDILGLLLEAEDTRALEKEVLREWAATSWDGVKSYFANTLLDKGYFTDHQVKLAASIAIEDGPQKLDGFFSAVLDMKSTPELDSLRASMVGALADHYGEGKKLPADLVSFFEQNLDSWKVRPRLLDYAIRYAPDEPEKTFKWVSSLDFDDPEVRIHTYGMLMLDTTLRDMPYAADLLSSETFLTDFYRGDAYDAKGDITPEARDFYDSVLKSFMDGLLMTYPSLVEDTADAFFSEEARETYRKQAREMLEDVTLAEQEGTQPPTTK